MTAADGDGFRRIGDREVHQGHVWRVVVADFEAPDGTTFSRDVVRSPGAVAAVPLVFDAEGNPSVVLLRQYRPAYEREIIEIPAGMRDVEASRPRRRPAGSWPRRSGWRPGRLELLTELLPSPGLTDSVTTIYLASGLRTRRRAACTGPRRSTPSCSTSRSWRPWMVERGEVADAKSVVGLLLTERRVRAGDHG